MSREVYIVGGGSSLKDFPWDELRSKDTIAVNMAALDVPNPTYCLTADSTILQKVQEGRFKNIDTTWVGVSRPDHVVIKFKNGRLENDRTGFVYNPFAVDILIKFHSTVGIGFSFNDFRTGGNSGFCAFQLAVLLGYDKIYLLGFDLRKGESTHYHSHYNGKSIGEKAFTRYYNNFVSALQIIKEQTDIQVISCSKISKLNDHIEFIPFIKTLSYKRYKKMPIFVSHYTKNTPYEAEAKKLEKSLKKYNLQYEIVGTKNFGSWRANSNYCATQVQKMLKKYPGKAILRLDADSIVQRNPILFTEKSFRYDIAACIWMESRMRPEHGEFLGGTLYFANTEITRKIVDEWVKACEDNPRHRNGDLLEKIIKKYEEVRFGKLPLAYCKIFDSMRHQVRYPVIEHFQASRKYKKMMGKPK